MTASYGVWTASLGLAALHGRSRQTWRGDLVTQQWETGAHWDLWFSEFESWILLNESRTGGQRWLLTLPPAATGYVQIFVISCCWQLSVTTWLCAGFGFFTDGVGHLLDYQCCVSMCFFYMQLRHLFFFFFYKDHF